MTDENRSTNEYYRLHTDAVDRLINTNESNSNDVTRAELRKYRSHSKFKLSMTVKALFIKFWFPAAICFFFMWGLPELNIVDLLLVLALAGGTVTELLSNNVLRFIEVIPGENSKWMMYSSRKHLLTMPLNVLHTGIIVWLVYCTYNLVNSVAVTKMSLPEGSVFMGVEPIGFGLIFMAYDLMLIGCKNLLKRIIDDAKSKVGKA